MVLRLRQANARRIGPAANFLEVKLLQMDLSERGQVSSEKEIETAWCGRVQMGNPGCTFDTQTPNFLHESVSQIHRVVGSFDAGASDGG